MDSLFKVFLHNFASYDFIIFIFAAFNCLTLMAARRSSQTLYKMLHLTVFVPEKGAAVKASDRVRGIKEEDVAAMRNRSARYYSFFVNLTGIFPLLGILGTVTALLPMVSRMADVTSNFYGALTSTFWGLVFGIAFKLLDGLVSPTVEDNEKNAALFLERNGRENG